LAGWTVQVVPLGLVLAVAVEHLHAMVLAVGHIHQPSASQVILCAMLNSPGSVPGSPQERSSFCRSESLSRSNRLGQHRLPLVQCMSGMARPCSCPARRKVLRGIKKHKEHVPCHTNPHHPPSARSASISVRIASILSVSINVGRSFGNSNSRALNLSAGSPTFRAA